MKVADLVRIGDVRSPAFYAAVDAASAADVNEVLALGRHQDAQVRRAVALCLPLLTDGGPPSADLVNEVVRLSADPDMRVRDVACFALCEQWREIDGERVVEALASRLDDIDRDTRSEALLGLAYRNDSRALPRVREALSRPGVVWRSELAAAGALSDPSLHELVLRHRHGWNDAKSARTADIAARLTDPVGPGDDVVDGVALLYRRRVRGVPDGDALDWWFLMDEMLDLAPHRAPEFFDRVTAALGADETAVRDLHVNSTLAQRAHPDRPG